MKRNMPKCKKHVQLVQSPEKMRAGLIKIVDNQYIVLEQLTSFASASEKQELHVRNTQKTSGFILIGFHHAPLESYGVCRFNYLSR